MISLTNYDFQWARSELVNLPRLHVLKTRSYPMIVLKVVMMMMMMMMMFIIYDDYHCLTTHGFFSWIFQPARQARRHNSPVPTADRLTELSWHDPALPHLRPPSAWVSAAELRQVSDGLRFCWVSVQEPKQYPKMRISQWTGLDWSWFDNICFFFLRIKSYSLYKWILTRQFFSSRCVQLRIFNKHRIPVAPRVSRTLANPA